MENEIKARRITAHNPSRQLSALRGLDQEHFRYPAGVLFNEDSSVRKACLVPFAVVHQTAKCNTHWNGWKFELRDELWSVPGVKDITEQLVSAQQRV